MKLVRTMIVDVYCIRMKRVRQEYIGLNDQDLEYQWLQSKFKKTTFSLDLIITIMPIITLINNPNQFNI